ncbi:MAG: NB-ARC domain-containing protein [Stenomitos frigidus ULC029]
MTVEEGLELIEQVLPQGQLSKIQEVVFRHSWEGQSYKEIAEQSGYTLGYIKDTGSDLWKVLSDALEEKVTRRNFQVVLKRVSRERGVGSRDAIAPTPDIRHLIPYQDWGEAIDVSIFYNRADELAQLAQWVQHDRCHLVTILGMGGMGKTALSVKLAEQVQDDFDYLIWRSLRHAPSLQELLADLISVLSDQAVVKLSEATDS